LYVRKLFKLAGSSRHIALAFGDEVEEKRERRRWGVSKCLSPQTPFSPALGGVLRVSSLQA